MEPVVDSSRIMRTGPSVGSPFILISPMGALIRDTLISIASVISSSRITLIHGCITALGRVSPSG